MEINKKYMHISNELPQFKKTSALIVATGAKEAKLYVASNSNIEELESFQIKSPQYSKEWTVRGVNSEKGSTSIHSAYSSQKTSLLTDFLHHFSKHIENIAKKNKIMEVYIFCPPYMESRVEKVISTDMKKIVKFVFRGNFIKSHPFEILEMIKNSKQNELEGG